MKTQNKKKKRKSDKKSVVEETDWVSQIVGSSGSGGRDEEGEAKRREVFGSCLFGSLTLARLNSNS